MMGTGKVSALALALLPGPLHALARRWLFKQQISRSARIRFGTVIISDEVTVGPDVRIGPFSLLHAKTVILERGTKIQPFSIVQCGSAHLKENSHIGFFAIIYSEVLSGADFVLGVQSRVFPFCWIDPGEGVFIGDQTAVGTYTMIYTHGVWANYMKGGPVKFAPVRIGDHVWLPPRVFIMPGVTIGSDVIVGAGSLVNKDLDSNSVYAGSPAKKVKENWIQDFEDEELILRIEKLTNEFSLYQKRRGIRNDIPIQAGLAPVASKLDVVFHRRAPRSPQGQVDISLIDQTFFMKTRRQEFVDFLSFLRRYGIRLSERKREWD